MQDPIKLNDPMHTPPHSEEDVDKEKLDPIVTGKVKKKKTSFATRFQKEAGQVAEHVWCNIVYPEIKNMIFSSATEAVGRGLFGDNFRHQAAPRTGARGVAYASYNRVASGGPSTLRPEPRTNRRIHEFDDYILESRQEAEEIIEALEERIRRYNSASVSDLNDLLGITGKYTDVNWGWFNLRNATSRRVVEGYVLDLPKPEPLR